MTQLISEQQAVGIATALKEWSSAPEEKTIADVLAAIQKPVVQMTRNGVSYEEIAKALQEHHINVTTTIVTTYFAPSSKGKGKRKRQSPSEEVQQVITEEVFQSAVTAIKELSQQKRGLTRKEFVQQNFQVIELCLAAGKDYPKISDFLEAKQGIKIAPATLAKYHRQAKKTGNSSNVIESAQEPVLVAEPSPVAQPPPRMSKRLREDEVELSEFNL